MKAQLRSAPLIHSRVLIPHCSSRRAHRLLYRGCFDFFVATRRRLWGGAGPKRFIRKTVAAYSKIERRFGPSGNQFEIETRVRRADGSIERFLHVAATIVMNRNIVKMDSGSSHRYRRPKMLLGAKESQRKTSESAKLPYPDGRVNARSYG